MIILNFVAILKASAFIISRADNLVCVCSTHCVLLIKPDHVIFLSFIQWDQAIELANQNNVGDVNNLLVKYANHLLEKDQKLTAIALYPNYHIIFAYI